MERAADPEDLVARSQAIWDRDVLPALERYTQIPNLSPHFAPDWQIRGHMDKAVDLIVDWCRSRPIDGVTVEVIRPDGMTPTIVIDVPAHGDGVADKDGNPGVLFYGHYDKQPEFTGWREGLGPWEPVREGDRLYGRGTADDGYSTFAALTAVEALRAGGGRHARCLLVIEGSEESGSPHLAPSLDAIADKTGIPTVVVALDTGCPTYDRLWSTTSLRGLLSGTLRVQVLEQGVHSGSAGGVVPSSFRIARMLLSRVEDEATGEILLPELRTPVSLTVVDEADRLAKVVGESTVGPFPTVDGLELTGADAAERLIRRSWEPSLSVVGAEGLPALLDAGNVLRPYTSLRLSFRLPPTCDSKRAADAVQRVLTADPPYGAEVTFDDLESADGWAGPELAPWLREALDSASKSCFGSPSGSIGEGGSIPFMGMLGERFPGAQIVATGVLGPGSNAHGPNEYLEIPMAVKLTAAMSMLLESEATVERPSSAASGQFQ